jgi:hypothetical protein
MIDKRFFKTVDECEVSFKVEPEGAEEVELFIESNGWEPISMKQLKSGPFKTKIRLPLDQEVQFRYRVNGDWWINDENADNYVANEHGSDNSVVNTNRNDA